MSVGLFAPDQDVHPQKEAVVVFEELVFSHNARIRIIDLDELARSHARKRSNTKIHNIEVVSFFFLFFLFARGEAPLDTHLLESGEGGEDGASDPDTVLALRRCDHLDAHAAGRQGGDLLAHSVGDAGEHAGPAAEDNVAVELLTDVHVALHDGVVGGLVHARHLHAHQGRVEEDFRAPEALVADGDHLPIRQLVALLERGARVCRLHLLVEVERHVAQPLLDVPHDLPLRGRRERVAALCQNLHERVRQVAPRKVQPQNGVRQRVAFVDGDHVSDTVSGVEHNSWCIQELAEIEFNWQVNRHPNRWKSKNWFPLHLH